MDSPIDSIPMYVKDPVINKEKLTNYTSYTLLGTRIPEPLERRYRDFASLREKLVERWPGIFIPNIPHKKTIGANDKEIIEMRIEMINRFCLKLSRIGYLFNSEEVELFLQNSSDVPKTLNSLGQQDYDTLLKKYSATFTSYDDNFDTQIGKTEQEKFYNQLKENYPRLKNLRNLVSNMKEKYSINKSSYNLIENMFSLYEKEAITEYSGNDNSKLVFFNMDNVELGKRLSSNKDQTKNPYDRLYDTLTEDYLDTEAMKEALDSLKGLQESYDKLTKNFTTVNTQLTELQAGKSNLKSIFSFKSREDDINNLIEEKDKIEKNLSLLNQIIKIATFNMQNEITNFKFTCLEHYYDQLKQFEEDTLFNAKLGEELWDIILSDNNISNCH